MIIKVYDTNELLIQFFVRTGEKIPEILKQKHRPCSFLFVDILKQRFKSKEKNVFLRDKIVMSNEKYYFRIKTK